jgi:hypothetical protein
VTDVVVVHRATHGQPWLNRRKIASSTISQKGMMLRVFSPPVSGTTPAQPYLRDPHARFCKLQLQSSASAQGSNGTALALRDFDLGGAKSILPGGRSVRCSLLNQQAFRLEKKFEMDHGFHRTPLVPGCLEALQYVSPGVARPRASCRRRFGNPIRRPRSSPNLTSKS